MWGIPSATAVWWDFRDSMLHCLTRCSDYSCMCTFHHSLLYCSTTGMHCFFWCMVWWNRHSLLLLLTHCLGLSDVISTTCWWTFDTIIWQAPARQAPCASGEKRSLSLSFSLSFSILICTHADVARQQTGTYDHSVSFDILIIFFSIVHISLSLSLWSSPLLFVCGSSFALSGWLAFCVTVSL